MLMGMGQAIKGEGICEEAVLTIQNSKIVEGFLPLELGSANVILGMQWLESLGGMQVNWKLHTMCFQVGGATVILQGDPSLSTSLVSLKAMWRALRGQGEGILFELGQIRLVEPLSEPDTPETFQGLLTQFQFVFQQPSRLPPCRTRDHTITLQPSTPPINVRPYRYPHVQKT